MFSVVSVCRIGLIALVLAGVCLTAGSSTVNFDTLDPFMRYYPVPDRWRETDPYPTEQGLMFRTNDPSGWGVTDYGPAGSLQLYLDRMVLIGKPIPGADIRVDFFHGAVDSVSFGFAMATPPSAPRHDATLQLFSTYGDLLGSTTVIADYSDLGGGRLSELVEGQLSLSFSGEATYGLLNFTGGQFFLDNFTYMRGTTPSMVPEPATGVLLLMGLAGVAARRRRAS